MVMAVMAPLGENAPTMRLEPDSTKEPRYKHNEGARSPYEREFQVGLETRIQQMIQVKGQKRKTSSRAYRLGRGLHVSAARRRGRGLADESEGVDHVVELVGLDDVDDGSSDSFRPARTRSAREGTERRTGPRRFRRRRR